MGVLSGYRIIEMSGIGPGPFCGMMLADMGAEVIRVDRGETESARDHNDFSGRGKKSVTLNLKSEEGLSQLLKVIDTADALIEGFRPGVMERLGAGPDVCLKRNKKLVYGRMTGWGQHGNLAQAAGHDLNYIAISGALGAMGRSGEPMSPPLNLVGDFGGGGMLLALGVVGGLLEAVKSGEGQVVDAAMTDGTAVLMTLIYSMRAKGFWSNDRGSNLLDGSAHFYDTYECKDGKYISIGSIEPQFYALLREHMQLTDADFDKQMDRSRWAELKTKIAGAARMKTRDEWSSIMEGTDVCFAPVLSMDEAPHHPHNLARQTFVPDSGKGDQWQPAPAPRFSRTPSKISGQPVMRGEHNSEFLK